MKAKAGTYALILQSRSSAGVQIGRWGKLDIVPGYYIYVGSAFGPGGVRARVLRHCRGIKRRHWHIDYLRMHASPVGAWYSYDATRLEHHWANIISGMADTQPLKGFGCSDCSCYSHLFYKAMEPAFAEFSRATGGRVDLWMTG